MAFEPVYDLVDHSLAFRKIRSQHGECMDQFGIASHMAQEMFHAIGARYTSKMKRFAIYGNNFQNTD